MQLLGEGPGPGHGANIGGHHHHVLGPLTELLGVVVHKDGVAQQVVHGDVEEALDLAGVQVHGQHPVRACGHDHVGHQLGGDGIAALGLAVLAGIAEIGDHGGDAPGGGPAAGVDHDQQLHEAVIDGLAGGVDEKHVAAADGFVQGDGHLAVGEGLYLRLAQLGADDLADLLCQSGIGVTGEHLDVLAMRNHFFTHSLSILLKKISLGTDLSETADADTHLSLFHRPRRRSAQPGLLVCRVRAMASAPSGTSSVTVDPAAV